MAAENPRKIRAAGHPAGTLAADLPGRLSPGETLCAWHSSGADPDSAGGQTVPDPAHDPLLSTRRQRGILAGHPARRPTIYPRRDAEGRGDGGRAGACQATVSGGCGLVEGQTSRGAPQRAASRGDTARRDLAKQRGIGEEQQSMGQASGRGGDKRKDPEGFHSSTRLLKTFSSSVFFFCRNQC